MNKLNWIEEKKRNKNFYPQNISYVIELKKMMCFGSLNLSWTKQLNKLKHIIFITQEAIYWMMIGRYDKIAHRVSWMIVLAG